MRLGGQSRLVRRPGSSFGLRKLPGPPPGHLLAQLRHSHLVKNPGHGFCHAWLWPWRCPWCWPWPCPWHWPWRCAFGSTHAAIVSARGFGAGQQSARDTESDKRVHHRATDLLQISLQFMPVRTLRALLAEGTFRTRTDAAVATSAGSVAKLSHWLWPKPWHCPKFFFGFVILRWLSFALHRPSSPYAALPLEWPSLAFVHLAPARGGTVALLPFSCWLPRSLPAQQVKNTRVLLALSGLAPLLFCNCFSEPVRPGLDTFKTDPCSASLRPSDRASGARSCRFFGWCSSLDSSHVGQVTFPCFQVVRACCSSKLSWLCSRDSVMRMLLLPLSWLCHCRVLSLCLRSAWTLQRCLRHLQSLWHGPP